jgi:hypothetical protein
MIHTFLTLFKASLSQFETVISSDALQLSVNFPYILAQLEMGVDNLEWRFFTAFSDPFTLAETGLLGVHIFKTQ